jgi:hypothetical protein
MRPRKHILDFLGDGGGDIGWPGFEQELCRRVGGFLMAEKAGKRRNENEKRKQRGEDRQRDMARDRPSVVALEFQIGVIGDAQETHFNRVCTDSTEANARSGGAQLPFAAVTF